MCSLIRIALHFLCKSCDSGIIFSKKGSLLNKKFIVGVGDRKAILSISGLKSSIITLLLLF
jgi:hypothetical protein